MTSTTKNTHLKPTNYLNVAVVQDLDELSPFITVECANYDAYLQQGDTCVIANTAGHLRLVEVVEIKETPTEELALEVVSGIDTFGYSQRVEQRKKAAELKEKMQKRAKQLQDIVLYQTLAKDDPEMAALLADFQGLGL
jgi:hypothetical protein